jgi:DNA modification methylase
LASVRLASDRKPIRRGCGYILLPINGAGLCASPHFSEDSMTAWQRHERIGDCDLYLGDCLEVMPELGRFDACVCDPPFGINMAGGFSGAGGFSAPISRRQYKGSWDSDRPSKQAFSAILASSGVHIIWGGQYFADLLPPRGKWLWWDKCQTMPSFGDGELAWTSLPGVAPKKFVYSNNGLMAKEKERVHPTQKPVALMRWCLGFLPKAETILDPFMGSGTTGVACVQLGRKFTGIELDPDYFGIACERIAKAVAEPRLPLDEPKAKPEQFNLLEDSK